MKFIKYISKTTALVFAINGVVLFFAGFLVARIGHQYAAADIRQLRQDAFGSVAYKYIDPLLGCSITGSKDIAEFKPLKGNLQNVIDAAERQGDASAVSVYFDTRDGKWLGINADEKYSPASLIKVPVMVGVLAQAENDPALLHKQIMFATSTDLNANEFFKPSQTLVPGSSYTVEELLRRMIVYSDNNALSLLIANANPDSISETLTDIGFPNPETASANEDNMTVKTYTNVFRFLHNASYLSRDMSEKALDLLAQTDFSGGIKAGIPSGVAVAQKFGERNFSANPQDPASDKELHDCGIVYYPGHPYLLCVMTKGKDFNQLSSVIQSISKQTYNFMNMQYDKKNN